MGDLDVLLVEDNQGDVRLTEQAFDEQDLPGTLHTVRTGQEAFDWLFRRGEFAEAPRPDIVLLDLNLPGTNGEDVLEAIKSARELRRIPVVVLTGSQSGDDIVEAYERYANACMVKPVDPDEFAERLRALADFWLSAVELPPAPAADDERTR